jgi:spore coat polysaccharide biosynthesis protein SpsF
MLKTLGIVQACSHLRDFHCRIARKLGGRSVLEWVIRRLSESQRLNGIIVLIDDEVDHRFLHKLVPSDIPIFVGEPSDALGRFAKALEAYPAEAVIRVRADNLFIDPALVDRLITKAESDPKCDYASYCSQGGRPTVLSSVGVYAEWIRAKSLLKAADRAKETKDRDHVTHFIHSHPEKFKLHFLPAPHEIDRDDFRLTVEQEEDWDHVLTLYEALGPEKLEFRKIAELLDHQPALRSRMAAMNRDYAHAEW